MTCRNDTDVRERVACSGSGAGSYLRLTDFVYHSNSRLESNKEEKHLPQMRGARNPFRASYLRLIELCPSTLGSSVIKKKMRGPRAAVADTASCAFRPTFTLWASLWSSSHPHD